MGAVLLGELTVTADAHALQDTCPQPLGARTALSLSAPSLSPVSWLQSWGLLGRGATGFSFFRPRGWREAGPLTGGRPADHFLPGRPGPPLERVACRKLRDRGAEHMHTRETGPRAHHTLLCRHPHLGKHQRSGGSCPHHGPCP